MTQDMTTSVRIAIGSDHAGFALKSTIKRYLEDGGYVVDDLGAHSEESVDYPDFAAAVANAVVTGEARFGILICGTGIGMSIAANKVPGIRAALCTDSFTARRSRAHNDANVLCLGASVIGQGVAEDVVSAFLSTPFDGGRHARRVAKISAAERQQPAISS